MRKLARRTNVRVTRNPFGKRARIWLNEEDVANLALGRSSQQAGGTPSASSSMQVGGDHDAITRDRDRWRAEALRLRDAGLYMAAAFDALTEADQRRADAEEHLRAAAACLDEAMGKARKAVDSQNQALRAFMIPSDLDEN